MTDIQLSQRLNEQGEQLARVQTLLEGINGLLTQLAGDVRSVRDLGAGHATELAVQSSKLAAAHARCRQLEQDLRDADSRLDKLEQTVAGLVVRVSLLAAGTGVAGSGLFKLFTGG